jgi:hypothetical protein
MVKMIVDPGLTNHPKFLALREAVGEGALEYLIRIWAHCQTVMKGGNWGKVTPHYVEMVAGWGSHWRCKGHLWKALLEPIIDGKTGFIEMDGAGNVIIHDWETLNKGLISNWLNGTKGGRPRQTRHEPAGNPRVNSGLTHREPTANPPRTDKIGLDRIGVYPLPPADAGSEDFKNFADKSAPPAEGGEMRASESGSGVNAALQPYPPTPEEMVRTLMNAGLSLETARKYHAWHSEKETWLVRRGHGLAVRSWEREVLRWQSEDRGQAVAGHAARGADVRQEDLERINAELQWQEEPGRRERLNAKRRELEQVLGAGVCT